MEIVHPDTRPTGHLRRTDGQPFQDQTHICFYIENITFFENLTLKLKDHLQYLETNFANDLMKELEPRIMNALKDCLPDQVQSQITSSSTVASKIASEVAATTQTTLQKEHIPLQRAIAEVKDTSEAVAFNSSSELTAHISDFQN